MPELRFGGPSDDAQQGATLLEAWTTQGMLFGLQPVCLLSSERQDVSSAGVDPLVLVAPEALVASISAAFAVDETTSMTSLVTDGQMGHALNITGRSNGGFGFWDPWPGRSLLCAENNIAGVDATQVGERAWWLSEGDFRRVLVASFVDPCVWGRASGSPSSPTLQELRESEFYGWFHLSEGATTDTTARPGLSPKASVELVPGAFTENIRLSATVARGVDVVAGQLCVRRDWLVSQATGLNPLALDLLKSFVGAFASRLDAEAVGSDMAAFFEACHDGQALRALVESPAPLASFARGVLVEGQTGILRHPWTFVRSETTTIDGAAWLRAVVETSLYA